MVGRIGRDGFVAAPFRPVFSVVRFKTMSWHDIPICNAQ
jgi:hypothetical protein